MEIHFLPRHRASILLAFFFSRTYSSNATKIPFSSCPSVYLLFVFPRFIFKLSSTYLQTLNFLSSSLVKWDLVSLLLFSHLQFPIFNVPRLLPPLPLIFASQLLLFIFALLTSISFFPPRICFGLGGETAIIYIF